MDGGFHGGTCWRAWPVRRLHPEGDHRAVNGWRSCNGALAPYALRP